MDCVKSDQEIKRSIVLNAYNAGALVGRGHTDHAVFLYGVTGGADVPGRRILGSTQPKLEIDFECPDPWLDIPDGKYFDFTLEAKDSKARDALWYSFSGSIDIVNIFHHVSGPVRYSAVIWLHSDVKRRKTAANNEH